MFIERSRDQKSKSLDAFYQELASSEDFVSRECGGAMLELLAALRAHPDSRRIFGLTSHFHLCFLSEDTWTSLRYVTVVAGSRRDYYIEYRMPETGAPWPGAYVRGEGRSLDEAIKMIVTAMDKSEGWSAAL